ncbi:MAG: GspE/PulE family protein [Deltaproteobacteria bacterium]|nr:GspE/PulE family protein [Deltaproteobacteria bacterium]
MVQAAQTPTAAGQKTREYQARLNDIYRIIHEAENFEVALPEIEKEMREILEAERITVYQRGRQDREIVSRFKTGDETKEFRLPLSPTSVASFVALSQKPLRIEDVYDAEALKRIHPKLKFDSSFDQSTGFRSKSMVVVPIKLKNTMLGVYQVINRRDGGVFSDMDMKIALELARVIGQKFQYDLQATQGPYDYLLHRKKVTKEQLQELKEKAAKENVSIPSLLVSEAKLLSEEVGESLERYFQVPFVKFDADRILPNHLFKNLKMQYLRTQCWLPLEEEGDKVVVLIDNPNDTNRIMEIQQVLNAPGYEFRVGIREDILRFLGVGGETVADESEAAANLEDLVGRLEGEVDVEEEDVGEGMGGVNENEATVVQLVNRLIVDAKKLNASDIHVEPSKGKANAIVRMRVDGVCREVLKIPASHIRAVLARIKIISKLDIAERRKPQDGKITAKFHGQTVELRVATVPTVNGESAVMRVLASGGALPMDKLNFTEKNNQGIEELVSHPHGIFLVVGPTGSGKTTTLHAILGHINTPDRKIWTAEDPVEITQPRLQQVQVEPKIDFTFAAAMRAFLRADPDVILIGEMRDRETSHIGVEASLTGHLVLSTLHTNSAPETITRLLDLGIDPLNFADAFLGVLAQRLIRTLCGECKEAFEPSEEEFEQLVHAYGAEFFPELNVKREGLTLYRAGGCDKCGKTGYRGRTGIHELLVSSPEMKKLIVSNSEIAEMRALAIQQGMRTLVQDGVYKIIKGQTDLVQLHHITVES